MIDLISQGFLENWNTYGKRIALILVSGGVLTWIFYYTKLIFTRDFKDKYDYINLKEINMLWNGALLILIGLFLIFNTLWSESSWLWFLVRIFISIAITVILGVLIQNVLKFYYPFFIEKRLKKLRYTPRISPDGRSMKLLSESEEDVHLDEGMQAEENVFSVDYDVWVDEESGYTKIEKYSGRLYALQCPNCNYQTLKVEREEVIQEASEYDEGELMKYYKCGYCGHKEYKSFRIAKIKMETIA